MKALHKKIFIISLVVITYMFLSFFRFGGLMAYIVPIISWSLLAFITLHMCGFEKIRLWFSKPLTIMATLIAMLQIVVLVFAAFFTTFGRSPYAHTPIAITISVAYFSSALLGLELSRAYLIKSVPKRKVFIGIGLTALFYTFITFSPTRFLTLDTPAETAKFLGSDFLPTLAQSILATYLALLGGPTASIAYLGTLEAFEWLSPILPNPTWAIKALVNTLVPTVGFLTVNQTVSPFKLARIGIISRSEAIGRAHRTKKSSSSLSWMAIATVAVILVWTSVGLFGFYPTVVGSGSMRPTLEVGDIAIVISTNPSQIKVGDIIQYWQDNEMRLHRVVEIAETSAGKIFVTRGDANPSPDPDPVFPTQIRGKLIYVIPKLGWISITLKNILSEAYAILTNLPQAMSSTVTWVMKESIYITSALALTAYSYLLLTYKQRKGGK